MKNKLFKLLPLLLLVLFVSCDQAPIFYDIAREIELAEPNVQGDVHSIVKLKDKLYTQNNKIFSKDLKDPQGWTVSTKPEGRVVKLASDDKHLYAVTAEQLENVDGKQKFKYILWSSEDGTGTWNDIETKEFTIEDDDDDNSGIVLFDNGVNEATGRNAYFRVDGKVYNLTTTGSKGTEVTGSGVGKATVAAAKGPSKDYFSDSLVFCSSGSKLYSIKDGKVATSTDNENWISSSVSVSNTTAMTYGYDKLYVGTTAGVEQVNLDGVGGDPESVSSHTGSNAEAALGGRYIISIATFGAIDENAIYAGAISLTSSKNHSHALWGYYPDRDNWNYE